MFVVRVTFVPAFPLEYVAYLPSEVQYSKAKAAKPSGTAFTDLCLQAPLHRPTLRTLPYCNAPVTKVDHRARQPFCRPMQSFKILHTTTGYLSEHWHRSSFAIPVSSSLPTFALSNDFQL